MSVDACLLLRVRDRPLFRRLVEALGDDRFPTLWPLEDDSIIVGTGVRWDEPSRDIEMRGFVHALTAGRLAELHDDPRGMYVCTDLALPQRRTYDGAVAELGGHFVDPAGPREVATPTGEDGIEVVYEALVSGDTGAFVRGLATSSASRREFIAAQWGHLHPDKPLPALPPLVETAAAPPIPVLSPPAFVAPRMEGAVSVLVPAALAALIDRGGAPSFEGARRTALVDGSAIYITDYGGDPVVVAGWLAAACLRAGIARAPCAFFRGDPAPGERGEMLPLMTHEEGVAEHHARARAWLAAASPSGRG